MQALELEQLMTAAASQGIGLEMTGESSMAQKMHAGIPAGSKTQRERLVPLWD